MVDVASSEELFVQLAELLRGADMGWVVEQVYEHVSEGKSLERVSVKAIRSGKRMLRGEDEELENRRSPYQRRVEFTPQERLALLARATKAVVEDALAMDDALAEQFGTVSFRPEVPEQRERSFMIEAPQGNRREAHQKLTDHLDQLIHQVES